MNESLALQSLRHPRREWAAVKMRVTARIKRIEDQLSSMEGPRCDQHGTLTERGRLIERLMELCAAREQLRNFYSGGR